MTTVPGYIEQRIRRPIPADSYVVPGSTPVVAFGNARAAAVATLGLNPSHLEFLDPQGTELDGGSRRLHTHRSLGVQDLSNAPPSVVAQVLHDCDSYFQRNPYRRWFDQLENVLKDCGASYYDGSACHLDLVQWATNPVWGGLPKDLKDQLIYTDAEFLRHQLTAENIKILLVNGSGAADQLRRKLGATLAEVDSIASFGPDVQLSVGKILDRVRVIAWSAYLQNYYGDRRGLQRELANRVARLA